MSNKTNNTKILFVDDELNILKTLKRVFRKEAFNLFFANSGEEGIKIFKEELPGIVVSDQQMPGMKGSEFLKNIREMSPNTVRILLTGFSNMDATIQAINEGGIHRYITKPWNDDEIKLVVNQAYEYLVMSEENRQLNELTRKQNNELKALNQNLENKVFERTKALSIKTNKLEELNVELENSLFSFIRTSVNIQELYNPFFGNHSKRVSTLSVMAAKKLKLAKDSIQQIEVSGLLHDIGMIGIPEHILKKTFDSFNDAEKDIYTQHPVIGESALVEMKRLNKAASIIRSHHENYDGTGYPDRIEKDNIPIEARIISVADAFDEVNKLDIYKSDPNHKYPVKFLKYHSGSMFDPSIVETFLGVLKELKLKISGEKAVSLDELKIGMVISKDIYFPNGLFLISKETQLNSALIKKMKNFNKVFPLDGKIFVYINKR